MFIRIICVLAIICCGPRVFSQQQDHFIYLQSDNKKPYYVKVGASPHELPSSSSGYLIVPNVHQGLFSFLVGFPDNAYPEQHFVCTIEGDKDKGFLLKRFPEKGWAIYDLQELTLIYAAKPDSNTAASTPDSVARPATIPVAAAVDSQAIVKTITPDTAVKPAITDTANATGKKDPFGDILVAVTNDPTLRDIKTVKKVPVRVIKPIPDSTVKESKGASITLFSRDTTDTGIQLVYLDRQASGHIDTVGVLLSGSPIAPKATVDRTIDTITTPPVVTSPPPVTVIEPVTTAPPRPAIQTPPLTPAPVRPTTVPTSDTTKTVGDTGRTISEVPRAVSKDTSTYLVPVFKGKPTTDSSAPPSGNVINTDCKRIAGDDDFMRLRKHMAAESDVDRMIDLARKAFRKSCFTADQVRNLSFLFLLEDGRFKFVEEAFPFVSDSGNFKSLQSLFTSVYFINRFKALVQR